MVGLALASLGIAGAFGQEGEETVLPLTQAESGHFVLDTQIGEARPLPFIFDTGANRTAILMPLAVELGLVTEEERIAILHSMLGTSEAPVRELESIDFGAGPVGPIHAALVPLGPDGDFAAYGLLGADAFAGRVITLDLAAPELRLDVEQPAGQADRDLFTIDHLNLLRASATVEGIRAQVMIDTGSPRTIANRALTNALYSRRPHIIIEMGDVTQQEQRIRVVDVERMRIGALCRRRFPVLTADLAIFETLGLADEPALIVGLDFLEESAITIDRRARTFRIDSPSSVCLRS
jgi:hypothetical protein